MHKIYKNFLNGESKLIDMFLCYPELHQKLKELSLFISKNDEYISKPSTTDNEKAATAENATLFTKKLPFYFPEVSITRKMHLICYLSPNCNRQNSKYLL